MPMQGAFQENGAGARRKHGRKETMSAPQTNLEKQKRWHRGPLVGMAAVVLIVLGLFAGWLVFLADDSVEPGDENKAVSAPVDG